MDKNPDWKVFLNIFNMNDFILFIKDLALDLKSFVLKDFNESFEWMCGCEFEFDEQRVMILNCFDL